MGRYLVSRLISTIPVLILVTAITFFVVHILPGDLASARLGDHATKEDVDRLRERLGLDEPLPIQYIRWLGDILTGDPGESLTSNLSVGEQLQRRLPVTIELALLATACSIVVGVPLGVLSAVRRGTALDHGIRVVSVLGQAIPSFWLGIMALTFLSIYFSWVPSVTYKSLLEDPIANAQQFALPVLVAGYANSAVVMRLTRSAMLDVLSQDYIRTARAKGLPSRRVVYGHGLRNAMIPVVTVLGTQMTSLMGGLILVETVFSMSGVGRLTYQAISERDYTQLEFNVLVIGSFVVLMNLAVDISYRFLDPRLRT